MKKFVKSLISPILQTVKNSLLKVKNAEIVYERDSVIFDEIEYSWQLLTGLMFCIVKSAWDTQSA